MASVERGGPGLGTSIKRGLVGRCPLCGERGIFTSSKMDLVEDCPNCGLHFEREDGFWLGSMIVIMAMVLAVFAVVTGGGILLFWPDVPWTGLMIAGIVANVAVPVFGYAWAKSVWLGLSWGFSPPDVAEEAALLAKQAAMDADQPSEQ